MDNVKRFAEQYGALAADIGKRIGVAPDVVLGQLGLETGWGKSVVPGTNNLGNIKDFSGKGVKAVDNMTGSTDAYRTYATPEAFGADYADLISRRYKGATGAGADALKFGTALKSGGYAEDPNYASKLAGATNLVRKYADMALSAVSGTANAATGDFAAKVKQAKDAGYTDDEIFGHLSQSQSFAEKMKQAKDAGYSDAEIRQHFGLSATPKAETKPKEDASTEKKPEAGAVTNFARGVAQGVKADLLGGPAQFLRHVVPDSVGNAVDRFGNWLADQGVPIARVNGAADLDRQIRDQEAQYQRDTEGSIAAGTGRVAANIAAALGAGGGSIVSGGGRGGQAAARLLGGGNTAQAVGRLAGQSVGSAALGAGTGALAPVTQEGDYGQNKLAQIATGAAIGGALPGATAAVTGAGRYTGNALRSLIDPFTEAGQNRIAGNILNRFAQGGPVTGNAAELVPGSIPMLAEATGNAGIGALERGLQGANPQAANAIAERALARNAARVASVENIAGSPAARDAAMLAREAATTPLYDQAVTQSAVVDKGLKSLLDRPSIKAAIGRAERLAEEQGGSFSLSAETAAPTRSITNTIKTPARGIPPEEVVNRTITNSKIAPAQAATQYGAGPARAALPEQTYNSTRTINARAGVAGEGAARKAEQFTPERTLSATRRINPYAGVAGEGAASSRQQNVTGQDLQTLKMAMDSLLEDPAAGIAGKEVSAVRDTRNALVNWMEKHIPEFTAARETYAEMSKPLAQMDIAQRLLERYASATKDFAGNPRLRAEAFNRALQDESKLLKNSEVFKGYKSLEQVFTPEQLASLRAVAEDLSRASAGQNVGRAVGSNTFQNLATNNILENALPGPVRALVGGVNGPVGTAAGKVGNLIYGGANEAIQNRLLDMMMNPQSGLAALQNVRSNQLTGPLGGNALLQRLAPNLLPAGTVGANMIARPSGSNP